jgi:hypothetical protein
MPVSKLQTSPPRVVVLTSLGDSLLAFEETGFAPVVSLIEQCAVTVNRLPTNLESDPEEKGVDCVIVATADDRPLFEDALLAHNLARIMAHPTLAHNTPIVHMHDGERCVRRVDDPGRGVWPLATLSAVWDKEPLTDVLWSVLHGVTFARAPPGNAAIPISNPWHMRVVTNQIRSGRDPFRTLVDLYDDIIDPDDARESILQPISPLFPSPFHVQHTRTVFDYLPETGGMVREAVDLLVRGAREGGAPLELVLDPVHGVTPLDLAHVAAANRHGVEVKVLVLDLWDVGEDFQWASLLQLPNVTSVIRKTTREAAAPLAVVQK